MQYLWCIKVHAWWLVKNRSVNQLWQIVFTLENEQLSTFWNVATDNQSVEPREAIEFCSVVKCVILCRNKLAHWMQLHGANWSPIRDMHRNRRKNHPEVDGSSGRCRLKVAWPVCRVLVVCTVFQWDTHLTRQTETSPHWVAPSLSGSSSFKKQQLSLLQTKRIYL